MKKLITESVGRFLAWKLPTDFAPDAGITFKRLANIDSPVELQYKHEPFGTNLFNDPQATAMLTYVAKPLLDRITELEALCLNALYHHQGASSAVGQPIRKALGMGQFDRITEDQLKTIHNVRALQSAIAEGKA